MPDLQRYSSNLTLIKNVEDIDVFLTEKCSHNVIIASQEKEMSNSLSQSNRKKINSFGFRGTVVNLA